MRFGQIKAIYNMMFLEAVQTCSPPMRQGTLPQSLLLANDISVSI